MPAPSVNSAAGVSFRELDSDYRIAQQYMETSVQEGGHYSDPLGDRLLKALLSLMPIWDLLAHSERVLNSSLRDSLPGNPMNAPTAIQLIYDKVLFYCNRSRPGGFRQLAHLVEFATESTDNRKNLVEYLEEVVAALSTHPLFA